ncbi:MAG TPA: HEAT repeat domain-containing protein [Candidatus Eisenbacteria bacterium]|jgi:HEAT repeat protein|nr:HEAT repeat domain-containing protein [Candidatus Eisenbacteria bacterium]
MIRTKIPKRKLRPLMLTVAAVALWGAPLLADEIDDLARNCESPDFSLSNDAFHRLGKSKDSRAVDALIRVMQGSAEANKRQSAMEALCDFEGPKDPRAVEPIIRALRGDSDHMVRAAAARALGELKDPRAVAPLLESLGNPDEYIRERAANALGSLAAAGLKDEKAFTVLLGLLANDTVSSARAWAADSLGFYADVRAVDPLLAALKDPDGMVRAFAAASLGRLGDKKAVEPLRTLIGDPDETARRYAADALKALGASADNVAESGDLRAALTQYLAEIQASVLSAEPRSKVIALVARMDPKPVIPEEARRAMARGKVEFENVRTADQWARPAEQFQTAANLAPWWPDAYFNLAMTQEKQGDYFHSIQNFKLYLEAAPAAQDAAQIKEKIYQLEYKQENLNKCNDLIERAADLQNASQFAAALPLLQEAVTLVPDSALAHANLGHAYEGLQQNKEALAELKEGIRLGETHYNAFFSLASLYAELEENYDEAIRVMEEGIRLNQYSTDQGEYGLALASMYRNLGYYYEKKGNYKKAIECYETAIAKGHTKADEIRQGIERIRPYAG